MSKEQMFEAISGFLSKPSQASLEAYRTIVQGSIHRMDIVKNTLAEAENVSPDFVDFCRDILTTVNKYLEVLGKECAVDDSYKLSHNVTHFLMYTGISKALPDWAIA